MKYLKFSIGTLLPLMMALNGCASITGTTANLNQGMNPVFSGTKINRVILERKDCKEKYTLKKNGCPTDAMMPFAVIDVIPSAIVDVGLLPITITAKAIQEKKNEKN